MAQEGNEQRGGSLEALMWEEQVRRATPGKAGRGQRAGVGVAGWAEGPRVTVPSPQAAKSCPRASNITFCRRKPTLHLSLPAAWRGCSSEVFRQRPALLPPSASTVHHPPATGHRAPATIHHPPSTVWQARLP